MKKETIIQTKKRTLIKYIVQEDCTLDYTNFEAGEEIEIPDEPDAHWKGTYWFDQYPQLFEPVYDQPEPQPTPSEVNEGKHTPGKLILSHNRQHLYNGVIAIGTTYGHLKDEEQNKANAARIVLTWNLHDTFKNALQNVCDHWRGAGETYMYPGQKAAIQSVYDALIELNQLSNK